MHAQTSPPPPPPPLLFCFAHMSSSPPAPPPHAPARSVCFVPPRHQRHPYSMYWTLWTLRVSPLYVYRHFTLCLSPAIYYTLHVLDSMFIVTLCLSSIIIYVLLSMASYRRTRLQHWTLVFPSGRRTFCGHSPCYGVFWGTCARHLGGTRRAS